MAVLECPCGFVWGLFRHFIKAGAEIHQSRRKALKRANRKGKKMIEDIVKAFLDYEITGEYLEYIGNNRYRKKYIKKWHLKGRRQKRKGCKNAQTRRNTNVHTR